MNTILNNFDMFINTRFKITSKNIIGVYSLLNSNLEGRESIAIFPDSTFDSVYFGGILKGAWFINDTTVYFTITSEPKIVLYGRKLELLKDTIQLDFSRISIKEKDVKVKAKSLFAAECVDN